MKQTIEIEIEVPDGYKAVYDENTQRVEIVKVGLPKTWEEFCKKYPVKEGEYFIGEFSDIVCVKDAQERNCATDRNILPNKKTAESILALMQLIQLRDYYREGWKPDWKNDDTSKYVISLYRNEINCESFCIFNHILSFRSERIRDEFLENFNDLIEKSKELDKTMDTNISNDPHKTWAWEKFCLVNPINKGECYINIVSDINHANTGSARYFDRDKNVLPNKETAEAFLALMQLLQLRDCYRQGWVPNWTTKDEKYTISVCKDQIYCDINYEGTHTLSFQSVEIRNEFFKNFRDLIEKAKELI